MQQFFLKHLQLNRFLFILLTTTALISIATNISAQPSIQLLAEQSTQTDSEQRQIIAEQFLDLIADGNYEEAHQYLHPVLSDEWTPEVMQTRWQAFQDRTGAFVQRLESRTIDQLVLITVEFTEVTDDIIFIFDSNQRITGVDFPLQPAEIVEE